jgi:plasmid stabilization system protein ParE
MVVIWLPEAEETLDRIFRFYSEKSERVAGAIVADIYNAVKLLAKHPLMAAVEPALSGSSKTYRSLVIRHIFKVIYRVDEIAGEIVIVTIWDCRQHPEKMKNKIK